MFDVQMMINKYATSSAYRKEPVVNGEAEIVVVELDERLPQVS
jgi:hypothetical protein